MDDPTPPLRDGLEVLLRFQVAGTRIIRTLNFFGCIRIHAQQKTSAQISKVGQREIDRLRERTFGYKVAPAKLETRPLLHPPAQESLVRASFAVWHPLALTPEGSSLLTPRWLNLIETLMRLGRATTRLDQMSLSLPADITQHNAEIQENFAHWQRKPLLREVYSEFYREIAVRLTALPPGPVVECGSGIGNLKSVLPDCLATDLFPNPWIDRTENIFALSFADRSVAALILFDVFHHLEYPGTALAELYRVLQPGGRVILFEPGAGLLGHLALGLFHHEPLGFERPITWEAPTGWDPRAIRYYAAQANAWRLFRRGEHNGRLANWQIREVICYPALTWLLCGGFRGPQLCPRFAVPLVRALERGLAFAPGLFASRMLIVLEKPAC